MSLRNKLHGTKERPRLNVYRSSQHIYASLIDDSIGKTLFWISDKGFKGEKETKSQKAFKVGKSIAEKAVKEGFKSVVFDRAGYIYHGRVKNVAEGAREGGLEF